MTYFNVFFQKLLLCSARVSFTTQDDEVQGFELSCDAEVKEESLVNK